MNTSKFNRIGFLALKYVLAYALLWLLVFGVSFAIHKLVGDATTANILQWVKYGGYPLLGIGWVLMWGVAGIIFVIGKILLGALWLLKSTFPYCLYVIGLPLVGFTLYKILTHLASNPGPSSAEIEAEARHQERMRAVKEGLLLRSISDMTRD